VKGSDISNIGICVIRVNKHPRPKQWYRTNDVSETTRRYPTLNVYCYHLNNIRQTRIFITNE